MRHTAIVLLFASLLLTGCGTAAMPVIQAAGMAKTAYDYSDVVMPRSRVDFVGVSAEDRNIEQAVRQKLDDKGVRYVSLAPIAMDGHLFLVGVFPNKHEAERARLTARQVSGVRRLTCSFFRPTPAAQRDPEADRELARRILIQLDGDEDMGTAQVRVRVLERSAVVMGRVDTTEQKHHVESLLRKVDGLREIRSYLAVRS
ncbi:MAG: BON domain-containing protein [Desulfovibrio sp.]